MPKFYLRPLDLEPKTIVGVRDKGRSYQVEHQEDDRVVVTGPVQGRRWRRLTYRTGEALLTSFDRRSCCPALPRLQELTIAAHRTHCPVATPLWPRSVHRLLAFLNRWRWGRRLRRRLLVWRKSDFAIYE